MMHPFLILLLGLATVLGMIIVLRTNAFVALITAAILVSLLAPGDLAGKIERAAGAFGVTAGKIGVVIALAAIVGKCLMDSGAADRIVRSLLRLLGEKRAPAALMASGYVLSMPVFFDTVFYLLVPLARSLWRRTHKNYMVYILAVACGGVITHTLVPPTPGPLAMADNLGVDLGVMILVGMLVGMPPAMAGLLIGRWMGRRQDLPMRPYVGETEAEPLADHELPPLWLSLVPVLLPVVLISANTVSKVVADLEHRRLVDEGQTLDWPAACGLLGEAGRGKGTEPARAVGRLLPAELQRRLARPGPADSGVHADLEAALAALAAEGHLAEEAGLRGLPLAEQGRQLRDRGAAGLSEAERRRLNWMILEAALPGAVRQTPRQTAAAVASLLGDPNLALFLSAVVAMGLLMAKRRLNLTQLGQATENALMSAGIIILITAAGGAFGLMLREAGLKDAVAGLMGTGGGSGLVLLLMGFAVASVMKISQGSGTVAMLTTSAMFAAMFPSSEALAGQLGCHPVYLACAIGSGSLVTSWMNDSGFWVVARMSALTEVETLRSWTILLAILGFLCLGTTLVAAWLFPMV